MRSSRNLLSCVATHFSVVLFLVLVMILCAPSISHAQSDTVPQAENIHIATLEGDYQAIQRLLDAGADPNEYNSTGFAPLHSAARANRSDIVNLLLAYGADVNIQSRTRIDPEQGGLHIAARNGYVDLINLLLSRGADPNLQDSRGNTPLHDAAISGDRRITRALVRSGADIDVRNVAGEDVLEVAAESLGRDAFSRNQIAIPITVGSYLDIDDIATSAGSGFANGLLRTDIGLALLMLFPLGDSIFFMGPELGISIPVVPLISGAFIMRVPVHVVFSIAARYNLTFDVIVGTTVSTWISSQALVGGMTFDVGGRVEINGFLVGLQYVLPVSVPFDDPPRDESARDSAVRDYIDNAWQNSLKISIGYRVRL